jgi:hypothetical protein
MKRWILLGAVVCLGLAACLPIPDFHKGSRIKYVDARPGLSPAVRSAIINQEVVIGMTEEEVVMSIGQPRDINRSTYSSGTTAQFVYEDFSRYVRPKYTYVYFENGRVSSWSQ